MLPPLKYLLPLLAVWGATMLMLFVIQDVGSALMYFGVGLALLYIATGRLLYPIAGSGCSGSGPDCSTRRARRSRTASRPGRTR